MKKPELLAPAGDLEKLKVAIIYGADAVFIGGQSFSLRSRASNFTLEEIKEACDFAHQRNARIHVTCNIVMHEVDTNGVLEYIKDLEECGVDAIIASSFYIIDLVKKNTKMEVHVSTQTSVLNSAAIEIYKSLGADRIVLGRELSLSEIKEIKKNSKTDIEVFIHGGMCSAYSGRCMLSNVMTNRDANRGGCAHSCRWNYDLYCKGEKINPDDDYFAMSSKDLSAIKMIPKMIDSNIDSFKIEGRMKSLHYIASVVKAYRLLIDDYVKHGKIDDFAYYERMIERAENRLTSSGFLEGKMTRKGQLYDLNLSVPTKEFIGLVERYDEKEKIAYIEQRNFFMPYSEVEVFGPKTEKIIYIDALYDEDDSEVDAARHPLQKLHFKTDVKLNPYDMLRLKK